MNLISEIRSILKTEKAGRARVNAVSSEYIANPSMYTGSKFPGGVGGFIDSVVGMDYWTLRARSGVLFRTTTYGIGIINRLVTNVINTGLNLECIPEERILGLQEDSLEDWGEDIENRFTLWGKSKTICDHKGRRTFGEIQQDAYREALIGGDVLVVLRQHPETQLPTVELIPGERVQSPMIPPDTTNKIIDGVELDSSGRHVAFWIFDNTKSMPSEQFIRVSARGTMTGRIQAFLLYGAGKREDDVRGAPLLAVAIQQIAEIDRYKDSAQRKATINSMMVGFTKRSPGAGTISASMERARIKGKNETTLDAGGAKPLSVAEILPGVWMDRLAEGEEPTSFATSGSDVNFGPFETAIVYGIAWALEIPPEILTLSFSSNYSASQAATSEFKIFLNKTRFVFGSQFCDMIYEDWFLSSVLSRRISAAGFLAAYASGAAFEMVSAWLAADWTGAIKPSIDPVKQYTGYGLAIEMGGCTRDRFSRETNGTKYTKNVRRLRKENEQLVDALRPLLEAKKEFGDLAVDSLLKAVMPGAYNTPEDDNVVDTRN